MVSIDILYTLKGRRMRVPTLTELFAVVKDAGQIISDNFGLPHDVTDKSDGTPVTAIDQQINTLFALLAEKHGIGFIGEEGNGDTDNDWILYVDPLDGTGAFLRGMATCTVVASIMFMGEPIMAIIHNPITGQTWSAEANNFCSYWRNKSEGEILVRTSNLQSVPHRTAICAWPGVDERFLRFQKRILEDSFFLDQQMGAFAIGGGLIASGLLDATAISGGSAVEAAAMSLIVREAGGVAVDLHGKEILTFAFGEHKNKSDFLLPHGAVFACNMQVMEALLSFY